MGDIVELLPYRQGRDLPSPGEQQPEQPSTEELIHALNRVAKYQGRPTSREIKLDHFRSERYSLVEPLIVYLQEDDGYYLAESFDVNQYGEGCGPEDAITMLCEMIEDYFDLLLEDQDKLSPVLSRHLSYLRRVLKERR